MNEKELEILRELLIDLFLDSPRVVYNQRLKNDDADRSAATNSSEIEDSHLEGKCHDQTKEA
ncbi:MAG TPA: hypothetical protein VFV38_20985 [Ktedonobacteraceae bacterium]|nr:hypothetical protein [Ktedonobacteraceae bacterium]